MPEILLVEDDEAIRVALARGLRDRSYAVSTAHTGADALARLVAAPPDVVLLDLGLPDISGLTLISMIRAVSRVPLIVITAQDDDPTIVRALDSGADDYVVKPFGAEHVAARIRAVLRRGTRDVDPAEPLRIAGLVIDEAARQVTLDGRPVELARKEFDLLLALAHRRGQVVSKRELLAEVWQQAYGGGDRTIDVHLSWLRRKLGESAAAPRFLVSVRGVGIRLVDPGDPGTVGDVGDVGDHQDPP